MSLEGKPRTVQHSRAVRGLSFYVPKWGKFFVAAAKPVEKRQGPIWHRNSVGRKNRRVTRVQKSRIIEMNNWVSEYRAFQREKGAFQPGFYRFGGIGVIWRI